jgi:hypothetical protein
MNWMETNSESQKSKNGAYPYLIYTKKQMEGRVPFEEGYQYLGDGLFVEDKVFSERYEKIRKIDSKKRYGDICREIRDSVIISDNKDKIDNRENKIFDAIEKNFSAFDLSAASKATLTYQIMGNSESVDAQIQKLYIQMVEAKKEADFSADDFIIKYYSENEEN